MHACLRNRGVSVCWGGEADRNLTAGIGCDIVNDFCFYISTISLIGTEGSIDVLKEK